MMQYFLNSVVFLIMSNAALRDASEDVFTIDTPGCKIPAYPLVTDEIKPMIAPPNSADVDCSSRVLPLVEANSTHIWVVPGLEDSYQVIEPSEFYCCYRNFSARGSFENIGYGPCQEFNKIIKASHEFVRVECYHGGDKIYEDLFRFNFYKKNTQRHDEKSFSVIMLGIDGVSRKNFIRTMPKTASFLKYKGSVQLQGYNKLGDNSLPNLFPMLAGKSFRDAQNICFRNNIYDARACPFLWDMYKSAGYQTALASDSAIGVLGTYEAILPYKPTDYYMQAFLYETRHTYKDATYDYHICLRNRYMYRELLKYAQDVVTSVRRGNLFGYFWEESVTHHGVNYPYIMDNDYFNLLHDMEKKKILDDTIVILFSDHGTRFGPILQTEEGRHESRLPLFEVLFPLNFRRKYQLAFKTFEMNSRRLTTPNDVHQTLMDLINLSTLEDHNLQTRAKTVSAHSTALSLFLPVPTNRTCKSVNIPKHWCDCLRGAIITISVKGQAFTANYLLRHINKILGEYPQCHKLAIEKIVEVTAMKDDDEKQRTYRVLLQTKPGGGMFEGTLLQEHKFWMVSGSVSRLNSYKEQSHCVTDPIVKMYCYCGKPKN